MFIGLITAYNEEGNIGPAVESLLAVGCGAVVVVDGAWVVGDHVFGGGPPWSTDGTKEEALAAGAAWVCPRVPPGDDGAKRSWALHHCGAGRGDHLFLLDADERAGGLLGDPPSGHGMVMLRNDKPNDLPGVRTGTLDPAQRAAYPLLRWLRYYPSLRCHAPGRYLTIDGAIEPYLVRQLADRLRRDDSDALLAAAYRALRDHEAALEPAHLTTLPILPTVWISHCAVAPPGRVAAKREYYEEVAR